MAGGGAGRELGTRHVVVKDVWLHLEEVFSVARKDGRYRGTVVVKQRDFEIQPISIAGGAVKVKDEVKVEFDIVASR